MSKNLLMVLIEDDILQAAQMTENEFRAELAVWLYEARRLTFSQARRLAGMDAFEFEALLAQQGAAPEYSVEDLHEDFETVKSKLAARADC